VSKTGVPAGVRRFIGAEIQSVEQLEVLLLLRGAPDKGWTAKEVARALVSQTESAASWLRQMEGRGLMSEADGVYRYAPATPDVARTIDELAESYARYRVAVIGLIFAKPSERVTLFSDAFRVRRRKD
jgi:predicted transcriptional regulator